MYYLSVWIDNRRYDVLTTHEPTEKPSSITPFVVQREANEGRTLFGIAAASHLVYRGGYSQDLAVDWSNLNVTSAGEELIVTLAAIPVGGKLPTEAGTLPQAADFQVRFENGYYSFDVLPTYKGTTVTAKIQLMNHDKLIAVGSFRLNLAPQDQIFDVVMDFGSEASQVVAYRRGALQDTIVRMNLVEALLNYYYPSLRDKPLHQQAEDTELYRSAFFLKKEGSVFDLHQEPGKHGINEFLNLLTNRQEISSLSKSHYLVSNLKLAHLGAYTFQVYFESPQTNAFGARQKEFSDTIVKLQQAVVNYFLQTVVKQIRDNTREKRPIYVVVRLLVPNVFDQRKVAHLVNGTEEGLAQIALKFPEYLLSGHEVLTISESDASFLGFKRLKEDESRKKGTSFFAAGRNYIIIDVGKGTTDFSILSLGKNYQLSSLYRSGFIGAGNVISYAFIDTIFAAVFGTNTAARQKALWDICLSKSAGLPDKMRFIELVEELKRNYKHKIQATKYQKLEQIMPDQIRDIRREYEQNPYSTELLGELSKAIELVIRKQGSIQDEFEIIQDTAAKIVSRIHQEVQQSGFFQPDSIDKIILTGRGFKFDQLVEEVQKEFKIPTVTTDELKKVCLLGAFSGDRVNFDANLVGYPSVYQILNNSSEGMVRQIDLGDSFDFFSVPKLNIPVFNRLKMKTGGLFRDADSLLSSNMTGRDIFAEETPASASHSFEKNNPREQFFLKGEIFKNFNRHSQTVSVCGLDYKNHTIDDPAVNVFYTGDDFIIRGHHTYSPLRVYPTFFQNNSFVFQTLFPFVDTTTYRDVAIKTFEDDF